MESIVKMIMYYFVAFGVVIGGSLFGGLAAFLVSQSPMQTMKDLSDQLKIWALVVALGGTFDSFKVFESTIFEGNLYSLAKQILYISVALIGAYTGQLVVEWLIKGEIKP